MKLQRSASLWRTILGVVVTTTTACGRTGEPNAVSSRENAASASCPAQTILTTSSGGSVSDSDGNTWTLASDGSAQENGNAVAGGGGTSEITAVDGAIFGQDASSGNWYAWADGQWQGPKSLPQSTCTTTPQVVILTRSSGGSITDADGNTWTLTSDGTVEENGRPVPGGAGTASLTLVGGVIWGQDASSGGWYAWQNGNWNGPSGDPTNGASPPSSPPPSNPPPSNPPPANGAFHVASGQVVDANGNVFIARGVDILEGNEPSVNDVRGKIPQLNFVRYAIYTYPDPNAIAATVNSFTSQGIVVELEDHASSDGQDRGGGTGVIFTGGLLQNELAWYQSVASAFAGNPYVWFGTNNEPSETDANGQTDPAALSVWQRQTYDAIRNSGNANPVMLEPIEWSGGQVNVGFDASQYASMTNTIWDMHFYGWLTNYDPDQTTNNNAVRANAQAAQQIHSADGVMPIIIGEFGNSTTGADIDANGDAVINAVIGSGYGCVAWAWSIGYPGDGLLNSDGSLSSYGQEVESLYAQ